MKIHKNIIKAATNAAKKSDVVRGKIGAVLFTNSGQVLCSTCNKILYGQVSKLRFTVHAEMSLLAKVTRIRAVERYGLSNLNILVVRYKTETDGLAIAKPCDRCSYYLSLSGLRVYFSDSDGNIEVFQKIKTKDHKTFQNNLVTAKNM